jgi:hypothetical protein
MSIVWSSGPDLDWMADSLIDDENDQYVDYDEYFGYDEENYDEDEYGD